MNQSLVILACEARVSPEGITNKEKEISLLYLFEIEYLSSYQVFLEFMPILLRQTPTC